MKVKKTLIVIKVKKNQIVIKIKNSKGLDVMFVS